MRRFLKQGALVAVAAALVAASLSLADQSGSGDRQGQRSQQRGPKFDHRSWVQAAAEKLGVSSQQLRTAMRAAHEQVGPPAGARRGAKASRSRGSSKGRKSNGNRSRSEQRQRGERPARPTEAQLEQHCTQLTDAIAKQLDKSGDDVRSAFKSAALSGVEKAQADGKLTEAQAAEIKSRIESRSCFLPPPPHHGRHGGPHGPPPPGMEGPPPGAE